MMKLTKETIHLPLGCLQGGRRASFNAREGTTDLIRKDFSTGKLSDNEVDHTICLIVLVKIMLCRELHCQKLFRFKLFPYKIASRRDAMAHTARATLRVLIAVATTSNLK